mmetsp:Transcript_40263/g.110780  ORF Transcript_40263/g.110780 Transcript_40263/m.110780 type:complete len:238 (-) Transcript_40263:681-1394(-)
MCPPWASCIAARASPSQAPRSTASIMSEEVTDAISKACSSPSPTPHTAATCIRIARAKTGGGVASKDSAPESRRPSQPRYVANPGRPSPLRRRRASTSRKPRQLAASSVSGRWTPENSDAGACADGVWTGVASGSPLSSGKFCRHSFSRSSRRSCVSNFKGTSVPALLSKQNRISISRNRWPKRNALLYIARAFLRDKHSNWALRMRPRTCDLAMSWKSGLVALSNACAEASPKKCV